MNPRVVAQRLKGLNGSRLQAIRPEEALNTMSIFFDSPIQYCPVANRYVLLDQTQECCARDMNCPAVGCPLARYFAQPLRPKRASRRGRGKERVIP